jgi:hypothetical protein
MANKRIELEQYKSYVNLIEEDPNRKTVRKGLTVVFVTALLLIAFLFVMGIFSNNLAKNPRNVLEKPPAATPSTPQLPGGTQLPQGTQLPEGTQLPGGTQVPVSPDQGGLPMAPDKDRGVGVWDAGGPSLTLKKGALLALQTQPGAQTVPQVTIPPSGEVTIPGQSATVTSSGTQPKKPAKKEPGQQTTGIGNLSNLAKGAGGRGFIIYILVLSIVLAVIINMALWRARKEGIVR